MYLKRTNYAVMLRFEQSYKVLSKDSYSLYISKHSFWTPSLCFFWRRAIETQK